MGDELRDQVRIAEDDRLLQLEVEYHVEHVGCERLLELVSALLPGRDAIGGPNDLDQS